MKHLVVAISVLISFCSCAKKPADYVATGKRSASQGNIADAKLNFRKALQLDADHGEARYELALLAIAAGDGDEAMNQLKEAARLLPDREEVQVAFADLNLEAMRRNPASAQFAANVDAVAKRLLARNPKSFEGLRLAGIVEIVGNRPAEALARFANIDPARQQDPRLTVLRMDALQMQGDAAGAEKAGLEALARQKEASPVYDSLYLLYVRGGRLAEAEAILQRKSEAIPADAGPILQLATFYGQQGRRDAMRAAIERLTVGGKFRDGWGQAADFYLSRGEREEAARVIAQGIQAGANERELRMRQASLLLVEGKPEEAREALRPALERQPQDPQLRALQAVIAAERNRPEERAAVIQELQAVSGHDERDPIVPFALARAWMASGDPVKARAALGESLKRNGRFVPARLLLAENYLSTGRVGEALETTERVLEIQPGLRQAQFLRAELLTRLGKYPEARLALTELERSDPKEPETLRLIGNLQLATGYPAAARETFARMAANGGGELASLGGQAEALLAMKQPAQAVQLLQAAAAKRPDEPALRNLLGATAMKAGQPGVAVAEFSALAAKFPKSVEAKLALAQAHQMERRLPDARQVLEAARQLAPADVRVLGQLGDVAAAEGDFSKALGLYREVAAQRPRDALVLNNIAYALVETNGDLNEAVAKSSEAVRLAPDRLTYLETLGVVYRKKAMHTAAVETFRTLVGKAPASAGYRYQLALALADAGSPAEATAELRAALSRNPDKSTAERIRAQLQKLGARI